MTASGPPIVVAMLGTDHHPFDRLVDWVDKAAGRRPDVRFVVQYGASKAPQISEGQSFFPHAELLELLASAQAAVCHGGPGTIMDARGLGHVPVCVPRDPGLGEHVDGHHLRFAALVHHVGVVTAVAARNEFLLAVDEAMETGTQARPSGLPPTPATQEARARLAQELYELLRESPAPHWRRPRNRLRGC